MAYPTNNEVFMKGMPLKHWILTHLDKKTIFGLVYVEKSSNETSFKFPWKRVGDQNWKQDWNILFEYAKHRGFFIPPTEILTKDSKEKLTEIKNKFRNAMDKSQEFEKLKPEESGYKYYRLKKKDQDVVPPKRKRKHDSYTPTLNVNNTDFLPSASFSTSFHDQNPGRYIDLPGDTSGDSTTYPTSTLADLGNDLDYLLGEIQPDEITMMGEVIADPGEPSQAFQFNQPGPSQSYAPQIERQFSGSTSMFDDSSRSSYYPQQPAQPVAMNQYNGGLLTSTPQPTPNSYMSQHQPSTPRTEQVPCTLREFRSPLRKTDEVLDCLGIKEDDLATFNVEVRIGEMVKSFQANLKQGLQLHITKDFNYLYRESDPAVAELLDEIKGSKRLKYEGRDTDIKKILKCAYGGVVIRYQRKELDVYRLCQARVFVEGPFQNNKKEKLERCCKETGVQLKSTFSYHPFISDLQKKQDVKDVTKITIGIPEVSIEVKPVCSKKIRGYLTGGNADADLSSIVSVQHSIDQVTNRLNQASISET